MPLSSMTGFARADGGEGAYRWTWELRSVNGKGLDIRLRLPPGFEYLEAPAREHLTASGLSRGNIQATLAFNAQPATARREAKVRAESGSLMSSARPALW